MKHTINNPLFLKNGIYTSPNREEIIFLEDQEFVSKEVAQEILQELKYILPFAELNMSTRGIKRTKEVIKKYELS